MNLKNDITNAMKLFLLLFVLFWSFTWNAHKKLPFKGSTRDSIEKEIERTNYNRKNFLRECHYDIQEDKGMRKTKECEHEVIDKQFSGSGILIPTFKEWRKMEMVKHETSYAKDRILNENKKFIRRKLNYASSKCGAKILESNPEARHRMAVLSEKSEEYFLNPCRVRTWFVIELCDTVEATQIELANYELYSSYPNKFSVFWSDVYPTSQWNHLGTFVAKDKRAMQTFDVNEKNFGKFIKVIIHSHHGKEHYCPLSVVRVLGFSMEQNLKDIENDVENVYTTDLKEGKVRKLTSVKEPSMKWFAKDEFSAFSKRNLNFYTTNICDRFIMHCSYSPINNVDNMCRNKPICHFLDKVLKTSDINCLEIYCPKNRKLFSDLFIPTSNDKTKSETLNEIIIDSNENIDNFPYSKDEKDIVKDFEYKKYLRIISESKDFAYDYLKERSEKSNDKNIDQNKKLDNAARHNYLYYLTDLIPKNKHTNNKNKNNVESEMDIKHEEEIQNDKIDSAGLINKDSVLYKLSTKIKTLDIEVSLINKYLQQFSQSYRYQVESLKTRINKTAHVMTRASEKKNIINVSQDKNITGLKKKIDNLEYKTNYLMEEKKDMLKRVIELHGFFLIFEIIIISTIFSTFYNILKRKQILIR